MNPTKGKVYRTRDFAKYDRNPTRLAVSLVERGLLRRLRSGLFYAPKGGAFGEVPPSEAALLEGYFGSKPYMRSGPSVWNALGLGTTAVESIPLVYNTTKTGIVRLGDKQFEFRRVKFPRRVDREYLVVDLLENLVRAGADLEEVRASLVLALRQGRFDGKRLLQRAEDYGSRTTIKAIQTAQERAS